MPVAEPESGRNGSYSIARTSSLPSHPPLLHTTETSRGDTSDSSLMSTVPLAGPNGDGGGWDASRRTKNGDRAAAGPGDHPEVDTLRKLHLFVEEDGWPDIERWVLHFEVLFLR